MRFVLRPIFVVLIAAFVITPIYAFAASNTGSGAAGEAAAPISGWRVSNIHYQLAVDPSFVEAVTLRLDAPAERVTVSLGSGMNDNAACVHTGGYEWKCNFQPAIRVSSIGELRVIAAGN